MRTKGREQGRFVALSGFRKLAGPSGGCYDVLIVDGNGKPVSHLCGGIACANSQALTAPGGPT